MTAGMLPFTPKPSFRGSLVAYVIPSHKSTIQIPCTLLESYSAASLLDVYINTSLCLSVAYKYISLVMVKRFMVKRFISQK